MELGMSRSEIMAIMDAETEAKLREAFRVSNRYMLLMWRLGMWRLLNANPKTLGRYMVIVHTGRKSGAKRYTPVNYAEIDGDIYCTAGFGAISDWYRNIMADPNVELWLPNVRWTGTAEDVTDQAGAVDKMRQVLIGSAFAANAAGLYPKTMSDDELAQATSSYRLVRIRYTGLREGEGGPGDLEWVWGPVALLGLLALVALARSLRRRC
jgi:deazaflavin-dependent oxidoreductase (nitroreductase family)